MDLKKVLGFLLVLLVIGMLVLYWFIPMQRVDFEVNYNTTNFIVENLSVEDMQFYPNMRFLDKSISYTIENNCSLKKKTDMVQGFEIFQGLTLLDFYAVENNEDISIFCENSNKVKGNVFIAGEGGPTKVSQVGNFYIIYNGELVLIRDSECPKPNIAIHELLHVLGFEHSPNPKNIMYYLSRCGQDIGNDTISLINQLYSIPNNPDLNLLNVSAVLDGRELSLNLTIWNWGLAKSQETKVNFYTDGKEVGKLDIPSLKVGQGSQVFWQKKLLNINFKEIKFKIDYSGKELNKKNNEVILKIKK